MMEFTLSIDLGKKERIKPTDTGMPVDRGFIARALQAVAAEIVAENRYGDAPHQTAPARTGPIVDDTGQEVGSWRLGLRGPRPEGE